MRNIYFICNKWVIRKSINERLYQFGRFNYYHDAIKRWNFLEEHGWGLEYIQTSHSTSGYKYIYSDGEHFRIMKNNKHYGSFRNLLDAIEERDLLIANEWDIETLCYI